MKKEYVFLMFALCFAAWVIVVDHLIVPGEAGMKESQGRYSRFRIEEWRGDGPWDLIKDQIIIYTHAGRTEEFFHLEHRPRFEKELGRLEPGTPLTIRYDQSFPKLWQRNAYAVEAGGRTVALFSNEELQAQQALNWKVTGIACGLFLALSVLGFLNNPGKSAQR